MTTVSELRHSILTCERCALRKGCKTPVPGRDNLLTAGVFCFGEYPNWAEEKYGISFMGNSGKDHEKLLKDVGINTGYVYCTNALKCKVPFLDDDDYIAVNDEIIKTCKEHLDAEIRLFKGKILAPMGQFACKIVLGKYFDLEKYHGIPVTAMYMTNDEEFFEFTVLPMLHPVMGTIKKKTFKRALIMQDYEMLAKLVKGQVKPEDFEDKIKNPHYKVVDAQELIELLDFYTLTCRRDDGKVHIGVDTETEGFAGKIQSIQFSFEEGTGYYIETKDELSVEIFKEYVERQDVLTVFHHAKYDFRALATIKVIPACIADTMVAAYLLQTEPQGLKPLGYRHFGVKMTSFSALTYGPTKERYLEYFREVIKLEWPKPEPIEVWENEPQYEYREEEILVPCTKRKKESIECECSFILGTECPTCQGKGYYYKKTKRGEKYLVPGTEKGYWKLKQPQPIEGKIKRILTDYEKNGDDVNLVTRFNNICEDDENVKELLETFLGPIIPCDLSHISDDKRINYACKDADVTIRTWNYLWARIQEEKLEDTFWIDMEILEMVIDMEDTGFGIIPEKFKTLAEYYRVEMEKIQLDINKIAGYKVNLGSSAQVAKFLYDDLKIQCQKETKKKEPSTDKEALKLVVTVHPAVKMIMDWRGYQKNLTSFAEKLPKMAKDDGND